MRPIFIVGPTGSGKTELSLSLAEKYSAEIINADSMQLYRGMDIGTAKLSIPERRGIPHHILDIWSIDCIASVSEYQQAALKKIDELLNNNRVPIIVGGSMMYVQSLIDQWEFPQIDPVIRKSLEAQLEVEGLASLREQLLRLDPDSYHKILPEDSRRIIRALEVYLSTGQPYNAHMPVQSGEVLRNGIIIGVDRATSKLDERIHLRTEIMFSSGFVEEVQSLLEQGLSEAPTASKAIGYAQIMEAIAENTSFELAEQLTIQATKRYIRRQRSWFMRDQRIQWIDASLPLTECLQMIEDFITS